MSRSPDLACFQVKIYISRSYRHIADHRAALTLELTVDWSASNC